MNVQWISVKTLLVALCLPQQTAKPNAEPSRPVTIFEKPLSSSEKLIVTCEEMPLVPTPKQAAEQSEILRTTPGVILSDHLYAYSYIIVTKADQREILWAHHQPTFGAITPGKTHEMSFSIEVFDVALQGDTLFVLDKQGSRAEIKIIHLDPARNSVAARAASKHSHPTHSIEAVQSPPIPGRALEGVGPFDGVASGRILGPTTDGDVEVQLSHVVKLKDGRPRITSYHLTHDAQGREFWTPDPANIYARGEMPNNQPVMRQP